MPPLLQLEHVKKSFLQPNQGLLGRKKISVINDVSFSLYQGQCLGIIGESGSGKSTLGKLILGLEKPDTGNIYFNGFDTSQRAWRKSSMRRDISAVFQDYNASVNPYFTTAEIIAEPIDIYEKISAKERQKRIDALLEQVGLDHSFYHRFPHEMSGGQLQRICIARAIACSPKFILFDEAVSSLDISVQTQILSLLADLQKQLNLTTIFITHDLTTITYLCDKVIFFYQGQIVEQVDNISQLSQVNHPYSKQLLESILGF
ncbi:MULTISPECIES: ABC transporter ATP-binding protein [unclassified Gilliamella]|uniref:ABC transporter ATP-binding protein n=1 Tax=unclassified Gilliamella TaxID=2685620 RepID=UPI00130B132B|nr:MULTISPECIES: ATP-binding cassette domain-containing protein [unclassified Gilliamella]MWP48698.1 ATP-binding cassette domain-containing protein [Gilliamella sp. Lep-s35]MWP68485.1 ATP-binding cassette domain-containing protein [Gilliamella sp. Lep-s5]MWP76969.1 ATP-binding cassette domain-containing protein [Gilliamella sp. Lep-s21]